MNVSSVFASGSNCAPSAQVPGMLRLIVSRAAHRFALPSRGI
jgi:hypothetical protein